MRRNKKYILGYVAAIFILSGIYFFTQADAASPTKAIFAVTDLPPNSIIKEGDLEYRDGTVLDHEKEKLLLVDKPEQFIGKKVSGYGIRKDRPLLQGDVTDPQETLHEIKLMGDITIPDDAKVVSVILLYDQRLHPGKERKVLAKNVPVKEIYNNQNIPINKDDSKQNRVPKAISVWVNEQQRDEILNHENKGIFRFTTIP